MRFRMCWLSAARYLQLKIDILHPQKFAKTFYNIVKITTIDIFKYILQEGLAVASIARDVVVEMTPPRDDNAR